MRRKGFLKDVGPCMAGIKHSAGITAKGSTSCSEDVGEVCFDVRLSGMERSERVL